MSESTQKNTEHARVAVYLDFDNVVISRKTQAERSGVDPVIDIDAILDFASSFGTLATSRAYADWSRPENSAYQQQLVQRAVFLIQMFTTSGRIKNGADIRLVVDAVEELTLFPDLTHVVIVAGDSDYIPLAQHIKRHGRHVVGIGVAGSISKYLASACDEYWDYDNLPGLHTAGDVTDDEPDEPSPVDTPHARGLEPDATTGNGTQPVFAAAAAAPTDPERPSTAISKRRATQLLLRALQYGEQQSQQDWQHAGGVKSQILRMEPAFQESALGFGSFSDFLRSRGGVVELDDTRQGLRVRRRPDQPQR